MLSRHLNVLSNFNFSPTTMSKTVSVLNNVYKAGAKAKLYMVLQLIDPLLFVLSSKSQVLY